MTPPIENKMDDLMNELEKMKEKALRYEKISAYQLKYYHDHKNVLVKQKISKKEKYAEDEEYRNKIKAKNRQYSRENKQYFKDYYKRKKEEKAEKEELLQIDYNP